MSIHLSLSVSRCVCLGGGGLTNDRERRVRRRGEILKVLPFLRNINEEQATVRGVGDQKGQNKRDGGEDAKRRERRSEKKWKRLKIVSCEQTECYTVLRKLAG